MMTIDKAIEILAEKVKHPYARTRLAYPDALKLGIEALRREQYHRSCHPNQSVSLLPGETEE